MYWGCDISLITQMLTEIIPCKSVASVRNKPTPRPECVIYWGCDLSRITQIFTEIIPCKSVASVRNKSTPRPECVIYLGCDLSRITQIFTEIIPCRSVASVRNKFNVSRHLRVKTKNPLRGGSGFHIKLLIRFIFGFDQHMPISNLPDHSLPNKIVWFHK